jgi:hypothetical protein
MEGMKEEIQALKHAAVMFVVVVIMIVVTCLVGGCTTTKYVEVEKVRTDTLVLTAHERDSIWLHDSVYVSEKQKGDTLILETIKWHTKIRELVTHDTIYRATHDTIPKPYPFEKVVKVEKQLSWWQKVRQLVGDLCIIVLSVLALITGVKYILMKVVKP